MDHTCPSGSLCGAGGERRGDECTPQTEQCTHYTGRVGGGRGREEEGGGENRVAAINTAGSTWISA